MSEIKVNTITKRTGSTLTIGESGTTVALASGASQSGFKSVDWQAVVTADGSTNTTSEAGKGYFIDSSSATHTINLPSSPSVGDEVAVVALDGGSNNVTVGRNGSNIEGSAEDILMATNYSAVNLVYSDASNGWVKVNNEAPDTFMEATGGTQTTSGNFRVHTFNSSSNFVVSSLSAVSANNKVSYMVVAGGGGGGGDGPNGNSSDGGGGGGAGGFRESRADNDTYPVSPLNTPGGLTVTATTYPVTVGAGGAGMDSPGAVANGSDSTFSTITSAGGGMGGSRGETYPGKPQNAGRDGGSGGGAGGDGSDALGGSGNTPPVSPAQGQNGGAAGASGYSGSPAWASAGGGGATAVGANATPTTPAAGGAGGSTAISGSTTTYAGGGGGGGQCGARGNPGPGGGGQGGSPPAAAATAGSANTGGGGGGGDAAAGQAGGSGVVIIRYKVSG